MKYILYKYKNKIKKEDSLFRKNKKLFLSKKIQFLILFTSLFLSAIIISIPDIYTSFKYNATNGVIENMVSAILRSFLKIFEGMFKGLTKPVLDALQDAIFWLLQGEFIMQLFNLSPKTFVLWSASAFFVSLLIFSFLSILSNANQLTFKIIKATILFFGMPIIFFGAFGCVSILIYFIEGSFLNQNSISHLINLYTFNLITDNMTQTEKLSLELFGFLVSLFVLKNLFLFCVALGQRVFELVVFGVLGLIFAASGSVNDDGRKLTTYNSIMVTKLTNSLLCFIGYLFITNSLPYILTGVSHIKNTPHFSSLMYFKIVVDSSLILASFSILKSLSPFFAFQVSGNTQGSLATQLGHVGGHTSMAFLPFKKITENTWRFSKGAKIKGKFTTLNWAGKKVGSNGKASSSFLQKSYIKKTKNLFGEEKNAAEKAWAEDNRKRFKKMINKSNDK